MGKAWLAKRVRSSAQEVPTEIIMDIEALREMLRGNSAYLIVVVIFLVNIIFGALRKMKLQNKEQNLVHGRETETSGKESLAERYVQRKAAVTTSGSSNDMFPRGDSLSKTGRSAMFRR